MMHSNAHFQFFKDVINRTCCSAINYTNGKCEFADPSFCAFQKNKEKLDRHFTCLLIYHHLAVKYRDYAKHLLVKFVHNAIVLYRNAITVYNVHCLYIPSNGEKIT